MSDALKKFGRYFLLDRLAQGGMAEIFRARLAAQNGAGRLICIKRIITGHGETHEYLQMFQAEIKVTLGFNHPNIVQVYDFGEEQQQPFIAMEFVDGKNVRQFRNRFGELKQKFPIEFAVFIVEQAAAGLHYAHTFKDKITGEALHIVHRDISPQNILVSYDGNIKLIDFGIAKATTNQEATRVGVIKGKPSYLSPEQIAGETLDGRSDVFALGAVLWELLTGKKLFLGDNDLAVLKLIESANTFVKPPSTVDPSIPPELDAIVMKGLAKQRDLRYQTAEEMQRALHKFLSNYKPDFNPSDVGYQAVELFKNDIVEDRKRIKQLNEKAEQLLKNEVDRSSSKGAHSDSDGEDDATITNISGTTESSGGRVVQLKEEEEKSQVEVEAMAPEPANTVHGNTGRTVSPQQFSNPNLMTQPRPGTNPSMSRSYRGSNPAVERSSSQIHLSKQKRSSESSSGGGLAIALGIVAVVGGLAFIGPQFGVRIPILSDMVSSSNGKRNANDQGQSSIQSTASDASAIDRKSASTSAIAVDGGAGAVNDTKQILLKLNLTPSGGNVSINIAGKSLDPNNPNVKVSLDTPLELSIDRPDFKPVRREFVLESKQVNGLKEWQMDIALEPLRFGYLTIHTVPSAEATLKMGGSAWKHKTPIESEKIPVGTYTISLTNDVLGMEKDVTVTVEEGKSVNIDERLQIKN